MLIIRNDNSWYTVDRLTCTDWLASNGGVMPSDVKYVVDDNSAVYEKILTTPFFIPTDDGAGNLVDIAAAAPPEYVETVDEQIAQLKAKLSATDYQALKYAEGQFTEEEYAPLKAQRQAWRDEINALEEEIAGN